MEPIFFAIVTAKNAMDPYSIGYGGFDAPATKRMTLWNQTTLVTKNMRPKK
jgi:hypothetical protein